MNDASPSSDGPDRPGRRWPIDGVEFDLVDYRSAVEQVHAWRRQGRHSYVTVVNPHSVLLCRRSPLMREAIRQAGLVLPDGVGIIYAAQLLGYPHVGRVTGPSLMLKLCDWGRRHGYRHFFYGGRFGTPERLAERLRRRFPGLQVCGTFSPPFWPMTPAEHEMALGIINACRPDVVWVGLGAPKQEAWMLEHMGRVRACAMVGVGAAFDFHSGNTSWAPAIVRRLGLEWAYRLAREPRRLWRRNLDHVPFLAHVLRQRLSGPGRADAA